MILFNKKLGNILGLNKSTSHQDARYQLYVSIHQILLIFHFHIVHVKIATTHVLRHETHWTH